MCSWNVSDAFFGAGSDVSVSQTGCFPGRKVGEGIRRVKSGECLKISTAEMQRDGLLNV